MYQNNRFYIYYYIVFKAVINYDKIVQFFDWAGERFDIIYVTIVSSFLIVVCFGIINTIESYFNSYSFKEYWDKGTFHELISSVAMTIYLLWPVLFVYVVEPDTSLLYIYEQDKNWYLNKSSDLIAYNYAQEDDVIFPAMYSDNTSSNTGVNQGINALPFQQGAPDGGINALPFQHGAPGGGNPPPNYPNHPLRAQKYEDDYFIEKSSWYVRLRYNNHAYGTVSYDPFKDIDPQIFNTGTRVYFHARPGRYLPSISPIKELPLETNSLGQHVFRQSAILQNQVRTHNFADTIYHFNKTTQHRKNMGLPGWGEDREIAAMERDWLEYDPRGFGILKSVREFRILESMYRKVNLNYHSQLNKQFFEVD